MCDSIPSYFTVSLFEDELQIHQQRKSPDLEQNRCSTGAVEQAAHGARRAIRERAARPNPQPSEATEAQRREFLMLHSLHFSLQCLTLAPCFCRGGRFLSTVRSPTAPSSAFPAASPAPATMCTWRRPARSSSPPLESEPSQADITRTMTPPPCKFKT